jgi:hypothetical protein
MEQCPFWVANSDSGSQEMCSLLWNQKVQCRVDKILPSVPILSRMNPAHNLSHFFLKIRSSIPSMPGSSKWSSSFNYIQQSMKFFIILFSPVSLALNLSQIHYQKHNHNRYYHYHHEACHRRYVSVLFCPAFTILSASRIRVPSVYAAYGIIAIMSC